jgi:hypothetical protein
MQRFKTNKNFPDALMLQALGMMSDRSSTAQDCMICMEALNEDNPAITSAHIARKDESVPPVFENGLLMLARTVLLHHSYFNGLESVNDCSSR